MFLRSILSFILVILLSSTAYAVDWRTDPDCLAAIEFNETSGDFIDSCGTHDGDTTESPPFRIEGKFYGGVGITVAQGIVDFGDSTIWDGKSVLTISFWLKTAQDMSPFEAELLYKGAALLVDDSANQQRILYFTSDYPTGKNIVFSNDDYPTDYFFAEDNQWHMYTYTYSGTTVKGYRDCVQVGPDGSLTGTLSNTSARFIIGRKPSEETGPTYPYEGHMDDLIFIDRVITTNECNDLMTNGIDGTAGHFPKMFQGQSIKMQGVTINGG